MFTNKTVDDTPKINLLDDELTAPRGKKVFQVSRFILYLFIVLLMGFFVFTYQVIFTSSSIANVFGGEINFFKQLTSWTNSHSKLQGEKNDRINILLLGIGGEGHDGPYLTDTMMLLSLKPSTKKIAMVSIPRDLLVDVPGYGYWRINAANSWGEQNNPGNGGLLAKQVVSNIFDIPINYYVRVDFNGFEKIIDDVNGIKINVKNTFDDYQYPIVGNENAAWEQRFEHLHIDKGWQIMDGATALKFVRSRHGTNGENSDFARSRRQQLVLQALKEKLTSYEFWLNPMKINKVMAELASHIRTNLEPWEVLKLGQSLNNFDTQNIINQVLDDSPAGFLYATTVNDAFVLLPRGNNYSLIQTMVKNIFDTVSASTPGATTDRPTEQAIPRIEIKNGTTIAGLASRESDALKLKGYLVLGLGNAPEQNYPKTIIYKLNNTNFDSTQTYLEQTYQTKVETANIPTWVKTEAAPDIDFFIILGTNADNSQP